MGITAYHFFYSYILLKKYSSYIMAYFKKYAKLCMFKLSQQSFVLIVGYFHSFHFQTSYLVSDLSNHEFFLLGGVFP